MPALDVLELIRDHQDAIDSSAPGLAARLSEGVMALSVRTDELQHVVDMFSHATSLFSTAVTHASDLENKHAQARRNHPAAPSA